MIDIRRKWCRLVLWSLDKDDHRLFKFELSLGDRSEWWSDNHNASFSVTVCFWRWIAAVAVPGWRLR